MLKEATHHPYHCREGTRVPAAWPPHPVSDCSRLSLMKYFLSGLIPHLTFLIFDLLMVITHYAGFKGQIHKKVVSLPVEPFFRHFFQTCVRSHSDNCLILTRSAQGWWPIPQLFICLLLFWWRWKYFLEVLTVTLQLSVSFQVCLLDITSAEIVLATKIKNIGGYSL